MKKQLLFLVLIAISGNVFSQRTAEIDTIWGKVVEDKYRWLEDLESTETNDWLKVQDSIRIVERSGKFNFVYDKISLYSKVYSDYVFKKGSYYFKFFREERYPTASLYYSLDGFFSQDRFLFNPYKMDKKNLLGIDQVEISSDDKTLALVLSKNGSDWKTIRFLDMNTKQLLDDTLENVKYSSMFWFRDGVFYSKFDVKDTKESFKSIIKGQKLFYHKLGTKQENDILIYEPENELSFIRFSVTLGEKYMVLECKKNNSHVLSISQLTNINKIEFNDFIIYKNDELFYNVLGELNGKLLVHSNLNAPNGAIYSFLPDKVNQGEIFVPGIKDQLENVRIIGQKLFCTYDELNQSYGLIVDSTGLDVYKWRIPEGSRFTHISGGIYDSQAIFRFSSFTSPSSVYKLDLNTYKSTSITTTYINYDDKLLQTKKIFYTSKDSTVIPMYITFKSGLKFNGENPVLLYGYGGFGKSMEPFFKPSNILFLMKGGILATPCLRGGGDFPGWHEKGKRLNKQNTFDDFIAAAEYLIKENITVSSKIAVMGGSNGGLVVGACMVQRPDLFKVVVSEAGLLDMLRFHLFNIGYLWKKEYGTVADKEDFDNLLSYSPYHRIKAGTKYPATLLVASDNDDRVAPFHSFKFLASLQENGINKNPSVLYYHKRAGHSGNASYEESLQEDAYIYSFIFKHLGMEKKL